jgi:hypothetical protein
LVHPKARGAIFEHIKDVYMRDTMIFYRSFYDAIKTLSKEEKADIYEAIFEYGLNFNEIELTGVPHVVFNLIKPILATNIKNYTNGKKPKLSESEAKGKRKRSERQGNKDKDKDVNKDEDKDEDEDKNKDKDVYRKFKHLSITKNEVDRIVSDGYTLSEIDKILDSIENYAKNTTYVSLNLTARKWLVKEYGERDTTKTPKDFEQRSDYLKYCVKNNLTPEPV